MKTTIRLIFLLLMAASGFALAAPIAASTAVAIHHITSTSKGKAIRTSTGRLTGGSIASATESPTSASITIQANWPRFRWPA